MKKTILMVSSEKFTGNKVIYQDTLKMKFRNRYDYLNKNFDKTYQYPQCSL